MQNIHLVFLLLFISFSLVVKGQNKAVVLQNIWNNDLNNYNPKEYVDKLFDMIKAKLGVKDFVADAKNLTSTRKEEGWEKSIKEQVKERKAKGENAYFIAIASELRLPTFNLGKFLFKNPPRSSKLTFTLHVFDSAGTEVIGDTIINRGCQVKTIDEQKGSKFFYSDYNNFMSDMQCHLDAIRKMIQEKPWAKKPKLYMEAR